MKLRELQNLGRKIILYKYTDTEFIENVLNQRELTEEELNSYIIWNKEDGTYYPQLNLSEDGCTIYEKHFNTRSDTWITVSTPIEVILDEEIAVNERNLETISEMWGFIEDSGQIDKALTVRVEKAVNLKAGHDMMSVCKGEHKRIICRHKGLDIDFRIYNSNGTEWEYICKYFLDRINIYTDVIERLKRDKLRMNEYISLNDDISCFKNTMSRQLGSPSEIVLKHFPLFSWIQG